MVIKPKKKDQIDINEPGITVVAIATYSSKKLGNFLVADYIDVDGNNRRLMIPASIVNDLVKLKKLLIDNCFQISAEKNAWTKVQEILNEGTDKRMQLVESPGFHGGVFLLPNNEIIGEIPDGGCPPILDPTSKVPKHSVERQGTLQEWQSKVAMSALNSSRIMLALATTFSASLLHLTNAENGGIHIFGISSTGKTTCLYVAISVQGSQHSIESWSITETGVEEAASGHNDQAMVLDELGNLDGSPEKAAQKATKIIYTLTFGKDKRRSSTYTTERLGWRINIISSGENSLTTHATKGGSKRMRGEEVRLVDIPADAGKGLGIYEVLPDGISAAQFAEQLKLSCCKFYGVPQQLFLENLTRDIADDCDALKERIESAMNEFMDEHKIDGSIGYEKRMATRFALAYAGGIFAVNYGILPFGKHDVMKGVSKCYVDAIASRPKSEAELIQIGYEAIGSALKQSKDFLDIRDKGHGFSIEQMKLAKGYKSKVNNQEIRVIKSDTLKSLIPNVRIMKKVLDRYVAEGRLLCDANGKPTRPVKTQLKAPASAVLSRAYCFLPKQKKTEA